MPPAFMCNNGTDEAWGECCMRCCERRNCAKYNNVLLADGRWQCALFEHGDTYNSMISLTCTRGIAPDVDGVPFAGGLTWDPTEGSPIGPCWMASHYGDNPVWIPR